MIGIMGAMQEEIVSLKHAVENPVSTTIGGREYIKGRLFGQECVIVFSRWGKVAAAVTATTLITTFDIDSLLFTGVAGAIGSDLNIGDVVLGTEVYQHDMDATPLFAKREIPYLGVQFFEANSKLFKLAQESATTFFSHFDKNILTKFSDKAPTVHCGLIASGDQFVSGVAKTQSLESEVPGTLAVEMEGAAVAQVCFEHQVPCMIIRTISDRADHAAPIDFPKFVSEVATHYSLGIIKGILEKWPTFTDS